MSHAPRVLDRSEGSHLLERFLRGSAGLQAAPGLSVRVVPEWVAAVGLGAADGSFWLWLEPKAGRTAEHPVSGAAIGAGQLVLDLPPGRYLVDMLDATTGETLSRESAGGPPLVLGVPSRGVPLVAEIRPVGTVEG